MGSDPIDKGIRRLVLDVLKLHDPDLVAFALTLEDCNSVDSVNVTLVEVDSRTENVKVVLQGKNLNFTTIKEQLNAQNASIHSIDQVICGKRIVEAVETPQD